MRNTSLSRFLMVAALLWLLSAACNRRDSDRMALARVDHEWLYLDEVLPSIPEGAKESDSVFAVRSFVDHWIRQQLLLNHAEKNLGERKDAIDLQLQEYKNALLIYAFEEELVKQKLDTIVTDQQIKAYYDANKEDFVLKDNIVKVLYVKLYRNEASLPQFRRHMSTDLNTDRIKLADLARQYAANYHLADDVWLYFNDLLKEIPIVTYNQEAFLANNHFVEIKDSSYHYLIRIRDFRITDGYSPIAMEKERIRFSIINKRKTDIIQGVSKEIYERAARKNRFETYYTHE